MNNAQKHTEGQAMVMVMILAVVGISVVTASTAVTIASSQNASSFTKSEIAYSQAEAGIENAIISIIRDNSYSGETLTLGEGTVVVTVSGDLTKTITAVSTYGAVVRTVEATGTITNTVFAVTSWGEVP